VAVSLFFAAHLFRMAASVFARAAGHCFHSLTGNSVRASYNHYIPSPKEFSTHFAADRWNQIPSTSGGHRTMAHARAVLINSSAKCLAAVSNSNGAIPVVDICGIPKNHNGRSSVTCVLPKDMGAQRRTPSHSDRKTIPKNVVLEEVEVGDEVGSYSNPVMLSFCDWFYSRDQLCTMFSASYGIIVTQKFTPGHHVMYEGECSYVRHSEGLDMTVRGGSVYHHGYHDWKFEGFIVGSNGHILSYKTLFEHDEFCAIAVWPTTGQMSDDGSMVLRSVAIGRPDSETEFVVERRIVRTKAACFILLVLSGWRPDALATRMFLG